MIDTRPCEIDDLAVSSRHSGSGHGAMNREEVDGHMLRKQTLAKAQLNYTTSEKELLAVVYDNMHFIHEFT